ncbi:RNA 2',3'-cyclic phosphodiesterase [candidate division KSB1 bacterium]
MIRTFIAVEIPETVKNEIADFQNALRKEHFSIRWVRPENLHLTLKFIGDIPESLVEDIKTGVFERGSLYSPFEVSLKGTGVFPTIKRPKVFWAGITQGRDELSTLAEKTENALVKFGIEKDRRPFKPHLTIGRIKDPRETSGIVRHISVDFFTGIPFTVDRMIFMRSILKPSGAEYSPLAVQEFK